jgi:hypothetical protein
MPATMPLRSRQCPGEQKFVLFNQDRDLVDSYQTASFETV